jgi:hypothetical protein
MSSGEYYRVEFGFHVNDSRYWTPEHQIEYEENRDRVHGMVQEIAEKSIQNFMKENPDLFKYDWII